MEADELCGRSIKVAFFEQKAQQTGRVYKPSPRWNNLETWTSIGRNCLAANADPAEFVRAAFHYNQTPGGPFPGQLAGDAARKWYDRRITQLGWLRKDAPKFSSPYVMEIHHELVARMDYLLRMSAQSRQLQLKLKASDMPAWERVLLSGLAPEVMSKHAAEARRQLLANQALREALEELGWGRKLEKLEHWNQNHGERNAGNGPD